MDARTNRNYNRRMHRVNVMPKLSLPTIVGYMSVDGSRQYHSDLSQLKFITTIPQGKLQLDLNHNISNAVKRTTDENNEMINLLLLYLLDHKEQMKMCIKNELTFITYRRTLISVMCSAFKYSSPISVMACLHKNCIYLCSIETPQDIIRRKSRSEQDQIYCAWGYKFEQFMLSDLPNTLPNMYKPVIENEEFSIYYSSEIGNHSILYGAQIDGMLATNVSVSEPPQTNDFQTNLNYLRNNNYYLELKTNKEICNRRHEENFRKFKLLRCWCQCYLAGLKGLLVGFRNDDGIVNRVQLFSTEEIADCLKLGWDPQTALNYLDYFLTFVKKTFKEHIQNNSMQESTGPITLQFDVLQNKRIIVSQDFNQDHVILPDWYLDTLEK